MSSILACRRACVSPCWVPIGKDLVTEGRSLILYGKAGRGKTHLAVAIGYRAIQNGFETLCTSAAELIEDLSNASQKGRLRESLLTYTHPHVLVIDEVGYLSYGPDAANVLFHVVNVRHLKKRPMIFTTNKPLSEWGKVLHDEDLAAAILDRVLERGRFIHLGGPSGRTHHLNLGEALPGNSERLRISGIGGSEFPEPTCERAPSPNCGKMRPKIDAKCVRKLTQCAYVIGRKVRPDVYAKWRMGSNANCHLNSLKRLTKWPVWSHKNGYGKSWYRARNKRATDDHPEDESGVSGLSGTAGHGQLDPFPGRGATRAVRSERGRVQVSRIVAPGGPDDEPHTSCAERRANGQLSLARNAA